MSARPVRMDIYRTAIPMRSFEHAAARRELAEAIVARVEFSDGSADWGETLPRAYVTGETLETVVADLRNVVWPACEELDFDELAGLRAIPDADADGRCINAAACAFELAAVGRVFDLATPVAKLLHGSERPGKRIAARVSGVLGSSDPAGTARRLRMMRWFGLRDFKLKLGFAEDADRENLRLIHRKLRAGLLAGKCTLRVDVNGGWDAATTPDRVAELRQYGVCVVEQPVYCSPAELAELAGRCDLPLMADESLLTPGDAETLLGAGGRVWWNIRISKNGGFTRSMELARLAAEHRVNFVVGCMVGESSLLSAAQRRLLQLCPAPRFVEGNYGRFVLTDDLTTRSLRFGYGGRLGALSGRGLGVAVDPRKIARYGSLAATLEY